MGGCFDNVSETIKYFLAKIEGMNVLFVCNQGRHRSKTAEEIFKDRFQTRSAGLYNEAPVTEADLAWADVVCVMEGFQRAELAKRFPRLYLQKRILCLDIPDVYLRGDPELVSLLKKRVPAALGIAAKGF